MAGVLRQSISDVQVKRFNSPDMEVIPKSTVNCFPCADGTYTVGAFRSSALPHSSTLKATGLWGRPQGRRNWRGTEDRQMQTKKHISQDNEGLLVAFQANTFDVTTLPNMDIDDNWNVG